jgi:hypothetical protein
MEWIRKLGVKVETDWSGREAVGEPDARKLLEAIRAAGREAAELHQAFEVHCRDWERRQHEAGELEFQRFIGEVLTQQRTSVLGTDYAYYGGQTTLAQPLGGAAYSEANDVAAAARESFAQREPRKTFDEFEKRWRKGKR